MGIEDFIREKKRSPTFKLVYPYKVGITPVEKDRIALWFCTLTTSVPRNKEKPFEEFTECEINVSKDFFIQLTQYFKDFSEGFLNAEFENKYREEKPTPDAMEQWLTGDIDVSMKDTWDEVMSFAKPQES